MAFYRFDSIPYVPFLRTIIGRSAIRNGIIGYGIGAGSATELSSNTLWFYVLFVGGPLSRNVALARLNPGPRQADVFSFNDSERFIVPDSARFRIPLRRPSRSRP